MTEDPGVTPAVSQMQVSGIATTLGPAFKMVFLTVLSLTLISLTVNIVLVIALKEPTDEAKALIETCSTLTKTGFGAIVGLIGGKAF